MTDRCARITQALALLPLVFVVWMLLVNGGPSSGKAATIAGTGLSFAATVFIWRKYVRWNKLRSMSTAGISIVALAQAVAWQPLWNISGCGLREPLIIAQSISSVGAWAGICALLWWGALLLPRRRSPDTTTSTRRFAMTPNAARLTIGIALAPFLTGLFWIAGFALEEFASSVFLSSETRIWFSYSLCALFAVIVWLLLWRRTVEWTSRRYWTTFALALGFLISPLATLWINDPIGTAVFGNVWWGLCALAPVLAYALWLAGTAWTWRTEQPQTLPGFSPLAVAGGPAWCPQCGYSLTGLREVRCPECGWSSTVDDIVSRSLASALAIP